MQLIYTYVGPVTIADRIAKEPTGYRVGSSEDVYRWIQETDQVLSAEGEIIATFIVDKSGVLCVADRRCEHVACAGGESVLSAGEITFTIDEDGIQVTWVTNQSTGYCPEPESWPAVATALHHAGIQGPAGFSQAFLFRRCMNCDSINLIKQGVFECGVCAQPLPNRWNCNE